MANNLHIVHAQKEHLTALAPKLATDPLFVRYKLGPGALKTSLCQALARGEGLQVALASHVPVGLSWFCRDGAFARGAYLRLLAVAQNVQTTGIGTQLLAAFEAACLPAPSGWSLLCSDFNIKAQKFYTAHGYQKVGVLPRFVLADVDEFIFYKAAARSVKKNDDRAPDLMVYNKL